MIGFVRSVIVALFLGFGISGSAFAQGYEITSSLPETVVSGGSFDLTVRVSEFGDWSEIPTPLDIRWRFQPDLGGSVNVTMIQAPQRADTELFCFTDPSDNQEYCDVVSTQFDSVWRITMPAVTEDTDVAITLQQWIQLRASDPELWSEQTFTVRVLAPEPDAGAAPAVAAAPAAGAPPAQIAAVQGFATSRLNALLREQPDLSAVFHGDADGPGLTVSTMGDGIAIMAGRGGPVWAEMRGNRSTLGGLSSTYMLGSVGAHWQMSEGVVLGMMALTDRMDTDTVDGTGWLAGPYAVFRAAGQPLVLQARYLVGRGHNRLADGSTYGSRRSLAMVSLSGKVTSGAVEILPSLRAVHGREISDAFVDAAGVAVPSQDSAMTQVETGLAVGFPVDLGRGETRVRLGLSDIWTDGSAGLDGHRGEISIQLHHRTAAGGEFRLRLARDGLGMDGYKATRVAVNYSLRF